MKAIILAAGYGNRMRPLTDERHKTLLEVGGKTIIARIIDALLENGISDIVIVTGYRDEQLRNYLSTTYPDLSFTFVHNARYRQTNNIYSMALAFEAIEISSDIILIESDLIFQSSILSRLIASPYPNTALVDHYRSGMDGTVVTVKDGIITNVIPPHLQDDAFDFSDKYKTLNIYKFSKQFCETSFRKLLTYYARTIDDNCYYELILGILIYMQKETIHAEIVNGEKWAEVDDPNDLKTAQFTFNVERQHILDQSFGALWDFDVTDYCFIRNMYFPSHSMISEIRNNLPSLIHNYGSRQEMLDEKMAWFLLCDKANLIALNGLSQAYPLLPSFFESREVLIPAPTFGEYPRMFPKARTYTDEVGINTEEIERKAVSHGLVVIVNPNNPTGSTVPTQWIHDFALTHPETTVFVDESFIDFSPYPSIIGMLEKSNLSNVIVGKSLSKALGMPGVRLGYIYSLDKKFKEHIRRNIPIWNMNSIAEFVLEIILKKRSELAHSLADTNADRDEFARLLSGVPFIETVYPSGANFLLVQLKKDSPSAAQIVTQMLAHHAVLLKDVSGKFTNGRQYMRFAVRTPAENNLLLQQLVQLHVVLRLKSHAMSS